MGNLLKQFYRLGVVFSILATVLRIIETKVRAKNMFKGISIVLVSLVFWFFGFVMIMVTVFFRLSDLTPYIIPGLQTSLVSLGTGLLISLIGISVARS